MCPDVDPMDGIGVIGLIVDMMTLEAALEVVLMEKERYSLVHGIAAGQAASDIFIASKLMRLPG